MGEEKRGKGRKDPKNHIGKKMEMQEILTSQYNLKKEQS
jgi:hypothetical protein